MVWSNVRTGTVPVKSLERRELISNGGSKIVHHPSSSLIVTGHSLKKCAKLSRLLVSLSRILQNVQLGEIVLSVAFSVLFSDRPLLRNRYWNCRMSL